MHTCSHNPNADTVSHRLTKFVALAANQTALEEKTKGNSTKMAKVQSMATSASEKLTTLESNTTLVDACSSMASDKATKKGILNTFMDFKFLSTH